MVGMTIEQIRKLATGTKLRGVIKTLEELDNEGLVSYEEDDDGDRIEDAPPRVDGLNRTMVDLIGKEIVFEIDSARYGSYIYYKYYPSKSKHKEDYIEVRLQVLKDIQIKKPVISKLIKF